MQIFYGELWKYNDCTLIAVTTNGVLRQPNQLVMGAGAALQARTKIAGVETACAQAIRQKGEQIRPNLYRYEFLVVPNLTLPFAFGIFQTKLHFSGDALLGLVEKSTAMLRDYALAHPECKIRLNYPGIGLGGLKEADVLPIIQQLPDNVVVYRKR